jgi:DNA invertase Pin-like site-specific DNA recombinase
MRARNSAAWVTRSEIRPALLSTLLAGIAEFERELIKERTGDGRKCAPAAGVKFGCKPKLSPFQRAEAIKRRAPTSDWQTQRRPTPSICQGRPKFSIHAPGGPQNPLR